MQKQYTPGDAVAVADLEPGDTVFARHDRLTQAPTAPVTVERITPSPNSDRLMVVVQSVYDQQNPWALGWLNPARALVRAEPLE